MRRSERTHCRSCWHALRLRPDSLDARCCHGPDMPSPPHLRCAPLHAEGLRGRCTQCPRWSEWWDRCIPSLVLPLGFWDSARTRWTSCPPRGIVERKFVTQIVSRVDDCEQSLGDYEGNQLGQRVVARTLLQLGPSAGRKNHTAHWRRSLLFFRHNA